MQAAHKPWWLRADTPWRAATLTFSVLALGLCLGWLDSVHRWKSQASQQRQVLVDHAALRLHDWVGSRMLVLQSLAAMRTHGMLVDPRAWRAWAGVDMQTIDGLQAINWIDTAGVIRITAPKAGNEEALGKNVNDHPVAGDIFKRARRTGSLQASPPLDLFQGGRAFTTYVPAHTSEGRLAGFVNGVFRVDRIVEHALDQLDTKRLRVVLRDGDALLWSTDGDSDLSNTQDHDHWEEASLRIAQRTWTLALAPATPIVPLSWHFGAGGLILLLSLGAARVAGKVSRQARQTAQARAETQRMATHVAEVERLESLGRVTGGIAHDFNNILTVVIGRASALDELVGARDGLVHDSMVAILDAGQRAAQLIEMLLTFARRGDDVEGQVDAAAHLRQITPLLRHIAGRRPKLDVSVTPQHAPVELAPAALDRLLINLVTNAVEAVPRDGGRIDLKLTQEGDRVQIQVTDNGEGMDAATRARIFEPFFTTKDSGTGLGLAAVFGLVTQTGGTIQVDTAPGRGTSFTIQLPSRGLAPDRDPDPEDGPLS